MAGYHITYITKGILGQFSKIDEEFQEFKDAHLQKTFVMELVELSDVIGAIVAFYRNHGKDSRWINVHEVLLKENTVTTVTYEQLVDKFNNLNKEKTNFTDLANFVLYIHHYVKQFNLSYNDLYIMHKITERSFLNGYRQ